MQTTQQLRTRMERISALRGNARTLRDCARRYLAAGNVEDAREAYDLAENCGLEALRLEATIPAVLTPGA